MFFSLTSLTPHPTPGLAKDHKKYGSFFGTLPLDKVQTGNDWNIVFFIFAFCSSFLLCVTSMDRFQVSYPRYLTPLLHQPLKENHHILTRKSMLH